MSVYPRHRIPRPPGPPQLAHELPACVIYRVTILRNLSAREVSRRPSVNAPYELAMLGREERPFQVTTDIHRSVPLELRFLLRHERVVGAVEVLRLHANRLGLRLSVN